MTANGTGQTNGTVQTNNTVQTNGTSMNPAPARRGTAVALVAALALTGFCMRTAVTSVGAVLDAVERGVHTGSAGSGLITTLPVLCFATLGGLTPRVARVVGPHRLLVVALLVMSVGIVLRSLTGSLLWFALASVLALAGGAASNVLMPSLVKRHFPGRIGAMTATYTTALAVGTTAAIGLTVPISRLIGPVDQQWRLGLAFWALFGVLAALPWLGSLGDDRRGATAGATAGALAGATAGGVPPVPARIALWRSRSAWGMVLFFGTQSLQAYVAFGWFPTFLTDHGQSAAGAGLLVAFYSALSIPVSIVMPLLAARGARRLVVALSACLALAYAGLLSAPAGGAWAWMLLAGIGAGLFPLALTLIGLRTESPATTAALSAFAQGIGYLIAGAGPLLTGVLLQATGSWTWPFVLLFVALALTCTGGLIVSRPVTIDAELAGGRS